MSYVASICFGVCLYHTLLEYNILQQWVAPDVSAGWSYTAEFFFLTRWFAARWFAASS
jgi:hypothetical protein